MADELDRLLERTTARAGEFLRGLPERHVGATAGPDELLEALGGPLPDGPSDPAEVVDLLARGAEPGLVGSAGPRFFGFVIGGSVPAALGADWLTSAWDQNAGLLAASPAAGVAETVAAGWALDLLGLPEDASVGFVTGATMANFTALAAARHHVLAEAGWDVERDGIQDAPRVHVVAGDERHVTLDLALRYLGFGTGRTHLVPADDQGRMRADAFRETLARCDGPTIVCAQAGNVNTGALDPVDEICEASHAKDAWVHVDGAFGLWAAASPSLRPLTAGVELADSWATDAHKWLNVPYDCGLAICAHPAAHRGALATTASYLPRAEGARDGGDWAPEVSRRARGFTVWAALRSLGRSGVADLVDRCCAHARRFAERLGAEPGVELLNEVVLNQTLVRFLDPGGDHDKRTRAVVGRVQRDGTAWLGSTSWHGMAAMRISVSGWPTTTDDVDRTVDAILRAASTV
jgi:glutamate/tyrosine decarboxylase-like PLP-dependent enzyme